MAIVALPALLSMPELALPAQATGKGHFSAWVGQLDALEARLGQSQTAVTGFAQGATGIPTHQLMIQLETARLDLTLCLQVRNKLVEAVQEIYRTQI